jgi:methylated-DNA-[protein]-cysteine S-methyltransferase
MKSGKHVAKRVSSPLGEIQLIACRGKITAICLPGSGPFDSLPEPSEQADREVLTQAAVQLSEYFASRRTEFDLPLSPEGTEFQQRVWKALRTIPFGITWSYGQLARAIGQPKAARAVGASNAKNPLAIVVPCHRVIGADGTLTGFAAGMDAKRWLLDHEARLGR